MATVLPEEATDKTLTWTSDDETVATVDNGVVTAVANGEAVITVSSANGKTATCAVTVTTALEDFTLNATSLEMIKGDTFQIEAEFDPATASDKTLRYETGNDAVATVSATGLVTAMARGTTTITVTSIANPSISKTIDVSIRNTETEMKELTVDVTLDRYLSINADLLLLTEQSGYAIEDGIVMSDSEGRTHFTTTLTNVEVAGGENAAAFEYKILVVPHLDADGYGYAYSYPADGTAEAIGTLALSELTAAEKESGTKTVTLENLEIDRPPFVDDDNRSYFITRFYSVDDNNANITDRYIGGLEIMDEEGNLLDSSEDYATVAVGENYKVRVTFQQQAEGILLIPEATEGLFNENEVVFEQTDEDGYVFEATVLKSSKDTNLKIYVEQQYGMKIDEAFLPLVTRVTVGEDEIPQEQWGELHYYPALSEMQIQFSSEAAEYTTDYQIVGQKINAPDSYAFESTAILGFASVLSYHTTLTRNDVNVLLLEQPKALEGTRFNLLDPDFPDPVDAYSDGKSYNDGGAFNDMFDGDYTAKTWSTWRQPGAGGQDGADCWIEFRWNCYYTISELHVWYFGDEGMIPVDFRVEYESPDGKFGEEDGNILRKDAGITIADEQNVNGHDNNYVFNDGEGIVTNRLRFHVQADVGRWVSISEIEIYTDLA